MAQTFCDELSTIFHMAGKWYALWELQGEVAVMGQYMKREREGTQRASMGR
jgi:hypothetical protein